MLDEVEREMVEHFEKAQGALRRELSKLRTGRANAGILDGVRVDYYGVPTPIGQMATIKIPDARLITVTPWEKGQLHAIERAITHADLGLNPQNDGMVIRLPIPPLTGERRADLCKSARRHGEEAKIAIRAARRDANEMVRELEKSGDVSEDESRRATTRIQDLTDKATANVDAIVAAKEKEISEV